MSILSSVVPYIGFAVTLILQQIPEAGFYNRFHFDLIDLMILSNPPFCHFISRSFNLLSTINFKVTIEVTIVTHHHEMSRKSQI